MIYNTAVHIIYIYLQHCTAHVHNYDAHLTAYMYDLYRIFFYGERNIYDIKFGDMTRNQINDMFLFQNRVKVKVVGEVSEK